MRNSNDWLERKSEDFDLMIELLQAAKNTAFSFHSSPVNIMSEIATDLLLKLSQAYEEGVPKRERLNPTIIFDYRFPDPLGNASSFKRESKSPEAWDPDLSYLCRRLAIFFSRSIREDFSFQKDFHDLLNHLQDIFPPGFISQKSYKAEKKKNNIKSQAAKARTAYYRRRRYK